jgi:hypothetical protein
MDSSTGVLSPSIRKSNWRMVGRPAAAAASWSGGKTGSRDYQVMIRSKRSYGHLGIGRWQGRQPARTPAATSSAAPGSPRNAPAPGESPPGDRCAPRTTRFTATWRDSSRATWDSIWRQPLCRPVLSRFASSPMPGSRPMVSPCPSFAWVFTRQDSSAAPRRSRTAAELNFSPKRDITIRGAGA